MHWSEWKSMLKEELIYAESKDSGATFVKNLLICLQRYFHMIESARRVCLRKIFEVVFKNLSIFVLISNCFQNILIALLDPFKRHSFDFSVLPINSNANRSNQNGYSTGAIYSSSALFEYRFWVQKMSVSIISIIGLCCKKSHPIQL